MRKTKFYSVLISVLLVTNVFGQFVHPGLSHKLSDLDRMKAQIEAKIDPWYSSYQEMVADPKSSYDYTVQGDESFTEVGRDNGVNYNAWNSDIRAAYYNAIQWYVTGDSRHAEKAIEIFNAWRNITTVSSGGTQALSGAIVYIMLEAAEIIKSTYSGWSEADIQAFKDMLVYPGYSNVEEPDGISRTYGSFYWQAYQGDPVRHGNQGLAGFRAIMAMGIFMDNEIIYDRALRYIQGLPHRSDDIPYPSGPNTATTIAYEGEYADTYNYTTSTEIEDYGFNEVMTNYIWETGQCQESSRDQSHSIFGLGNLVSMAEMAWNQGDNLYGHENDLLLKGLEYTMKYNVSYLKSYPDQTEWWVPTVESGEFMQGFNASQRVYSKAISPINIGGFPGALPVFELSVAHYFGRGFKTEDEVKWIMRARDVAIEESGYEKAGHVNNALGWGALVARRPDYCYGDPISGFDSLGLPKYAMNTIPMTIEAENYDYNPVDGEGRLYHDLSDTNTGGKYRLNQGVDVDTCADGGYQVVDLEDGEWLSYTIAVPNTAFYNISIRYAASNANGKIKFSAAGSDITDEILVPFGGDNSNGLDDWKDLIIARNVILEKGVQVLKIHISGESDAFVLNNFTITKSEDYSCDDGWASMDIPYTLTDGINYNYYEGTWDSLPDFSQLTPIESGISDSIKLKEAWSADDFGVVFSGYVNIPMDGMYTFYTSSDGGTRLYLDGNLLLENDSIHSETEISGAVCLYSGYHEVRVEYFNTTSDGTLVVQFEGPDSSKEALSNYLEVNDPFARIEAEDYTEANGTAIESCEDTGGGVDVGSIKDGNWLRFSNFNLTEIESVNFRLASKSSGGSIEVRLGSETGKLLGTVDVPNTGDWQGWETVSIAIDSVVGFFDVYLVFKSSSSYVGNINWFEFSDTNVISSDVKKVNEDNNILVYPNPVYDNITVTNSNGASLEIYNQLGMLVIKEQVDSDRYTISLGELQSGFYLLRILNDGLATSYRIIKE